MRRKRHEPEIAAADFETDPFEPGATIQPFSAGIYDGRVYFDWWCDDVAERLARHLLAIDDETIVYAHNGGKFDFTFLLPWLDPEVMVISNRIVQCRIGKCELRDSFAILPVPLRTAAEKGEIDYMKMRRGVRDLHRREILDYLRTDCIELRGAVMSYRERFGDKLTMAGAAIRELENQSSDTPREDFPKLTLEQDAELRQFYFGGRVEAFERGIIHDDLEVVDMNSMYPTAMKNYEHPTSTTWREGCELDGCDFAVITAVSRGAFPWRDRDGSLRFPHGLGTFAITGHEYRTAKSLGLCDVQSVERSIRFTERMTFGLFVDTFYERRLIAKGMGDATGDLHNKLVLNGAYGRFSLNPDKLHEYVILPNDLSPEAALAAQGDPDRLWHASSIGDTHTFWARDVTTVKKRQAIRNVATGASITGASRAEMMLALHQSERPIYCDTDSVICRKFHGERGKQLGQWKTEAVADEAAIAGKKLYALFKDGQEVKKASKGVRLTAEEIRRVAQGEVIEWQNDKPTISMSGTQKYMRRKVQMR